MIEHRGDFYGVGQGLFTCGDVRANSQHMHYVYDCGGETSKRLLRQSIEEALHEMQGRPLDVLFLSHLHLDHTSGLDFLLKKLQRNGGVRKAVLPYLYPSERAALYGMLSEAEGYPSDPGGWYLQFLRAPATYLSDNGVRNVYFVRGGDGPETPPFAETVPPTLPEGPREEHNRPEEAEGAMPVEVLIQSNRKLVRECESRESSVEGDDLSAIAGLMTSRSTVVTPWWFFLLFNKDINESTLVQLEEDFDDIRQGRSLGDLLLDKAACRAAKVAYERIFGVKHLNDTSLAVLSACHPTHMTGVPGFEFGPYAPYCMASRSRFPTVPFVTFEGMRNLMPRQGSCIGFVLLGDLPANREWSFVSRKFGFGEEDPQTCVLTYQVSHHGSKENWSDNQLRLLGRPTFVVSAGTHNRHGHPDAEVLRDIVHSNNLLVWVSEDWSFPHSLKIG